MVTIRLLSLLRFNSDIFVPIFAMILVATIVLVFGSLSLCTLL